MSEFGFFGELFDEKIYVPAGFNAWRESDGELTIGEVAEMDYFRIEGTDKYLRGIDVPPGFWEYGDQEKQSEIIKNNMRAILQLFNIRVLVYPNHVEIKGTIPPQVLYQGKVPEPETALFISSACRSNNPTNEIPFVSDVIIQSGKRANRKNKNQLSHRSNK